MRDHYGNETSMNREIEEANAAIEHLHYKREYANFTFEDFVTQLTKHYNTLEHYGEFTSEETKVRNLLKKVTDPTSEAAKQTLALAELPHKVVDVLVVGISTMAVMVEAVAGSKVVAIKVVAVEVAGTNMVAGAMVDVEEDIPLPMAMVMALGILPM
jgi:hypothetical protein